jgi:acyl carrier protein
MGAAEVRAKVKEIISNVTSIPVEEIGDRDSYVEDLNLDSLSMLEIGVDVDYEFKLGLPEDQWHDVRTVEDAVQLVLEHQGSDTDDVSRVA